MPSISNISFIKKSSYNLLAFIADTLEREKRNGASTPGSSAIDAPLHPSALNHREAFLFGDFMV
jgi:hypothetical protein